ncbi:ATP-binding protein [Lentzea terrae]|uniref:ATP-binding protein n=1 Tax=Lentzea terrae TaxID=2200761 RepID=UPI001E3063FD|nr:tetratricopeptide repeat protein [Lentzea terrae]
MTPELDQPDDRDAEPSDRDGPGVRNRVHDVVGAVVQAGTVHGDVHLHAAPVAHAPVVPRQLPAAPAHFAGRAAELARLDRALTATTPSVRGPARSNVPVDVPVGGATVVVSAIGGAGGIGKTWTVLAWAHRHLDRFPDGQLFVDLHGFSPAVEPMTPAAAVRGFLDALGVDPGRIPPDLDAQAALYRSLIADRRMLVVLDNAAATEQVVPLLPSSPACTVLITARTRLASLIDRHSAQHLQLDVLARAEARALLTARLGTGRVAAEPGAVDELIELCGGYPLALSIAARNAAIRPALPLAEISAELRDLGLEMLDHDTDPAASLPAVLSWSLRRLTDEQRTVFGLLGIVPGPDTTLPAVVALTALSPARARRVLVALEEASLLERRPNGRYAMHDLVRAYAATTARDLPGDERRTALRRVVDFYRHTAHTADQLLNPHRHPQQFDPPEPSSRPHPLPDIPTALAWLDSEHPCLLAAQHTATIHQWHQAVWHLAWALTTFHLRRGHRHNRLAVWQAGLAAAQQVDDPAVHTLAHRHIGIAYARLGRRDEAIRHLHQALVLAERHHDHANQAHAHRMLSRAWGLWGDERRALGHAAHALGIFRSLDTPVWEAWALNEMSWCAARLGDHEQARDHCQAALALYRRHPDAHGEAATWDCLGYIDHHTGRHEQAIHHYQQSLTLYRDLGNTYELANGLDGLGHPHAALGQYDEARAVWGAALGLYRKQGRDTDAERVQRHLDDLGTRHGCGTE